MKILLVTPSYFSIIGGSEVLTRDLCEKINAAGIHADIMTFNMDEKWKPRWRREEGKIGGATIFREAAFATVPYPLFLPFTVFRVNVIPNLFFAEKLKEYDLIHFVGETDLSFPFFSFFVRKPKLLECVGTFRKGGIYKYYVHDHLFIGRIFRKVFPKIVDKFLVSSIEEKHLLIELGVSGSKIAILPTGLNTSTFTPSPTVKVDNLLLFVGRIVPIKGLHTLLQSLQYIKIPLELDIIGPAEETSYFDAIQQTVQDINKLGYHKVNLRGQLKQTELVPYYQKASLLVCPYVYETYSSVVREALACATPVVTTGSHMFENCSDGIVITPNSPISIANTITSLLRNPEERKKLGNAGRKVIEQYCSWDSVIKEYTTLYKETLSA